MKVAARVTLRRAFDALALENERHELDAAALRALFGRQLREERLAQELSLRHVARQVYISAAFLSDIERGNRMPSKEVFERLENVLRI